MRCQSSGSLWKIINYVTRKVSPNWKAARTWYNYTLIARIVYCTVWYYIQSTAIQAYNVQVGNCLLHHFIERKKFVVQPHPVQFNEEPHDWMVTQGASVSLTCNTTVVKVIGYINEDTTPLPQIRWFHNDVMINSTDHFTIYNHGIDTSTLTIRNVDITRTRRIPLCSE